MTHLSQRYQQTTLGFSILKLITPHKYVYVIQVTNASFLLYFVFEFKMNKKNIKETRIKKNVIDREVNTTPQYRC